MLAGMRVTLSETLRPPTRGHTMMVAASAVIGAIAVAVICYLLWPTWTASGASDPERLPVSIGNTLFNLPTESLRIKVQRHSGAQERVDLAFGYPALTPGTPVHHVSADTIEETPLTIDVIFLSIAAHGGVLAPEERARTIYPRYADPSAGDGDEAHKLEAFRQTLHLLQQRLQLLCNLPPEKLAHAVLQGSARQLAQA